MQISESQVRENLIETGRLLDNAREQIRVLRADYKFWEQYLEKFYNAAKAKNEPAKVATGVPARRTSA